LKVESLYVKSELSDIHSKTELPLLLGCSDSTSDHENDNICFIQNMSI